MKQFISYIILTSLSLISIANAHDHDIKELNPNTLKVYTESDFMPFNYYNENGDFVGIGVDIVNKILEDAKFDHTKPRVIPWARGYFLAQNASNTLLFSIFRTEQRKDLFYWIGPIATSKMVILTKKTNVLNPNNYSIAAVRDSASMQLALKRGMKQENIMRTNHSDLGLRLLNLDRVDAWAINYPTALTEIKKAGLNPNDYYIYDVLAEKDVYMVLSKDTNQEIKDYFTEKLDELKKNGFIKKTVAKYHLSDYKTSK
jgi:ABC-type amino acid transport substrate-binding protein